MHNTNFAPKPAPRVTVGEAPGPLSSYPPPGPLLRRQSGCLRAAPSGDTSCSGAGPRLRGPEPGRPTEAVALGETLRAPPRAAFCTGRPRRSVPARAPATARGTVPSTPPPRRQGRPRPVACRRPFAPTGPRVGCAGDPGRGRSQPRGGRATRRGARPPRETSRVSRSPLER